MEEKRNPNESATGNAKPLTMRLSWWQVVLAMALVAWLVYGKYQEKFSSKSVNEPRYSATKPPPAGVSNEDPICAGFHEALNALVKGSSDSVFRSGARNEVNKFNCTVEEAHTGQIATLGALRSDDPQQKMVDTQKYLTEGKFRVLPDPTVGPSGFYAIGNWGQPGEENLQYAGHNTSFVVSVTLSNVRSHAAISDGERERARELTAKLVREAK